MLFLLSYWVVVSALVVLVHLTAVLQETVISQLSHALVSVCREPGLVSHVVWDSHHILDELVGLSHSAGNFRLGRTTMLEAIPEASFALGTHLEAPVARGTHGSVAPATESRAVFIELSCPKRLDGGRQLFEIWHDQSTMLSIGVDLDVDERSVVDDLGLRQHRKPMLLLWSPAAVLPNQSLLSASGLRGESPLVGNLI